MAKRIYQIEAEVTKNLKVAQNYYKMGLSCAGIASHAGPGQFINLKVNSGCAPLLRRPFSIHRVKGQEIEMLYALVGKGTEMLSQKKPGEYLDVIGPLGNGFSFQSQVKSHKSQVLVAGGMGVAPLIFLAEKLAEIKNLPLSKLVRRQDPALVPGVLGGNKSILRLRSGLMVSEVEPSKVKIVVLLGAKTKKEILCLEEFRKLGCEVKIATDDGSCGFQGKVTDLLRKVLPLAISHKPLAIYACGPHPMLAEISRLAQRFKISAQVSLEEHLACGFGACLGCAVKVKTPNNFSYKRVCKEGPVFAAEEIVWEGD